MLQYPHNLIGALIAKDAQGKILQTTAALVSPNLIITSSHMVVNEVTNEYKFYPANSAIMRKNEGI